MMTVHVTVECAVFKISIDEPCLVSFQKRSQSVVEIFLKMYAKSIGRISGPTFQSLDFEFVAQGKRQSAKFVPCFDISQKSTQDNGIRCKEACFSADRCFIVS